MSWDAARAALDARFLTLPGLDPARIHWPNKAFDPCGQSYWKVAFLPAAVDPEMGSSKDHEKGVYQVSRFVPAGTNFGAALRDAQAVVDLFKRQVLSGVACGVPVPAFIPPEPDWLQIPVSIPFQVL